jgi:hypothetical protein
VSREVSMPLAECHGYDNTEPVLYSGGMDESRLDLLLA